MTKNLENEQKSSTGLFTRFFGLGNAKMVKEIEEYRSAIERLSSDKEKQQAIIEALSIDKAEALKKLKKHQIDLDDLREKYSEYIEREKLLIAALRGLRTKLQAASHYYHNIEHSHPELTQEEHE